MEKVPPGVIRHVLPMGWSAPLHLCWVGTSVCPDSSSRLTSAVARVFPTLRTAQNASSSPWPPKIAGLVIVGPACASPVVARRQTAAVRVAKTFMVTYLRSSAEKILPEMRASNVPRRPLTLPEAVAEQAAKKPGGGVASTVQFLPGASGLSLQFWKDAVTGAPVSSWICTFTETARVPPFRT